MAEKTFSQDRDLSVFVVRGVADLQGQRTEVRPHRESQRIGREVGLVKRQKAALFKSKIASLPYCAASFVGRCVASPDLLFKLYILCIHS